MKALNELSDYLSGMDIIEHDKPYDVCSKELLYRDLKIYINRSLPLLLEGLFLFNVLYSGDIDPELVAASSMMRMSEFPLSFLEYRYNKRQD